MFRVDTRVAGMSLWGASGGPSTAQAAWGLARALNSSNSRLETRIVPAAAFNGKIDLRV
jgi:hypothetical protein